MSPQPSSRRMKAWSQKTSTSGHRLSCQHTLVATLLILELYEFFEHSRGWCIHHENGGKQWLRQCASLGGHLYLIGDKCLFVLMETVDGVERIAGVAGLHVDDFLIGGRADSPTYAKAEKELREKFLFGKWSDLLGHGLPRARTSRSPSARRTTP